MVSVGRIVLASTGELPIINKADAATMTSRSRCILTFQNREV